MENSNQQSPRDEGLWKIAKRRAEFKKHLFIFVPANAFFWLIWAWSGIKSGHLGFAWPIFVTLGWGVGLTFSYIKAYTNSESSMAEKEYQKLVNKQN